MNDQKNKQQPSQDNDKNQNKSGQPQGSEQQGKQPQGSTQQSGGQQGGQQPGKEQQGGQQQTPNKGNMADTRREQPMGSDIENPDKDIDPGKKVNIDDDPEQTKKKVPNMHK